MRWPLLQGLMSQIYSLFPLLALDWATFYAHIRQGFLYALERVDVLLVFPQENS